LDPERAEAVHRAGFAGLISRPLPGSIVGEQVAGQRLQQVLFERAGPVAPEVQGFPIHAERSAQVPYRHQ
jgi:hypothetical protein